MMKEEVIPEKFMCLVCGEDLVYDPELEKWVCPNCASERKEREVNS